MLDICNNHLSPQCSIQCNVRCPSLDKFLYISTYTALVAQNAPSQSVYPVGQNLSPSLNKTSSLLEYCFAMQYYTANTGF